MRSKTSLVAAAAATQPVTGSSSGVGSSHTPVGTSRRHLQILLFDLAKFLGMVYYPTSLVFRLCFQPYFKYSPSFVNILVIDYLVDLIFISDAILSDCKIGPATIFPIDDDSASISSEDTVSTMGEITWLRSLLPQRKHVMNLISLFPVEFIGFLAAFKYYPWLRLNRMIKCLSFPKCWAHLLLSLEQCGIQINGGWARAFLLLLVQCLACHICACVYYALAVDSLRQGNEINWLAKTNMVEVQGGEVKFLRSLGHIYLEAIYFSAQTLQTVGFGDILAYNIRETVFVTLLCYFASFLVQSSIANLALVITNEDDARTKYIDRSNKFAKFAQLRNLSKRVRFQCQAFYKHQYSILHGLDEQKLISELPTSIQLNITNVTAKAYLKKVKALDSLPDYFISTLSIELQTETFLPGDEIVAAGSIAQGLYIVSSGVVMRRTYDILRPNPLATTTTTQAEFTQSSSENVKVPQSVPLMDGDCFGENSLFEPYNFSRTYQAKSFCELLFLSSSSFKKACLLHMTQDEMDKLFKARLKSSRASLLVMNPTVNGGDVSDDEKESDSERDVSQMDTEVNTEAKDRVAPMKVPNSLLQSVYQIATTGRPIRPLTSSAPHKRQTVMYQLSDSVLDLSEDDYSPGAGVHSRSKQRRLERQNMIRELFSPETLAMQIWNGFLTAAVIYYAFSIPLLLTSSFDKNIFEYNLATLVLAYIADVIMLLNFIGELTLFPFVRDGITFTKRSDLWINYRETRNIFMEIFALLPFDLLALRIGSNFLPLLRLSKLYHILSISRYLSTLNSLSTTLGVGQLLSLGFFLYMIIHWLGCLFIVAARISTDVYHDSINWIIADKHSEIWNFNYNNNLSGTLLYFRSIYWILSTTSSIGYYDILPTNSVEIFTVILIILFGCQPLNAVVGGIAGAIFTLSADRVAFQSKLKSINAIAIRNDVSKDTRDRIHYFYEYSWDRSKGVDEATVLMNLPPALRKIVINEIAGSVLRKIPFFQECTDASLHSILGLLKPRVFLDGDNIIRAGEYGMDFFVIESGSVKITSSDKSVVYTTLGPGDYLGESCLLGRQVIKRSASAYSCGYTYAYSLKNADFMNTIEAFPEEGRQIIQKIKAVLNSKIAKNATFTSLKSKVYLLENDHLALEVDYNHFYHPESFRRKLWGSLLMVIGVYNLVMIPLRLAIRISPVVYLVDYLLDVVLFVNLYLIYFKFYTIRSGILVTDTKVIQSHFFQENFTHHLVAYVPFDILVVFLLTQSTESTLWAMRVIRIPKIFLLFKFPENFSYFEDILSSLKVNYVGSRVIRMLIMVCLIGHWLACIFYLLPTLFNLRRASDCVNEPGAMYGTACQYEGTWIQFQIMTEKLPLDGGDDWARYLRALNWALPLLTLQVLADVLPINNLEFMYSFFGILIGLVVQSSIIGTMISLFAEAQESSDVQIVRKFLEERNVDVDLRMKVLGYLNFLDSPYAHTIMEEESINSELPYSLQLSIIEKTKLQLLSKCPLFDTCTEESKINLCFALTQQIYSDGDYIIKFGDMGHEMFFLAEGSVEVCSDSGVIYTILHAGSYFGETGLVFSDRRMSNIRAMGICVCYCLNRVHLDNELKASSEIDAKTAFATLKSLLERNQRINQAISKNLNRAKVHTSKLSKVIVVEETKPENKFLRALRNPHSNYCIAWDVMGFVALIYYSVAIPFHIGFLHGPDLANYTPFLAIDFFFDLYWAIDIYLRSRYFSIQLMTGKYDSDSNHIWKQYHSSYSFHLDCIASLPLEIFALIPGVPRISLFIFRFVHMIRIRLLFQQIQKIQNHLEHFDFRTKRSVIKLITTLIFYFFCNHWFSCGFFMIHRYLESSFSVTWAVADNLAEFDSLRGEHSVCSRSLFHCYSRSIYFVISTLSTVGFGDICPRTNLEFIYQLFVVGLSGLCLNALICSSFLELWNSVDNASHRTYQKHLQIIDHYVKYRKLSFKERNSIVGNFEYLWSTERQSGGYETNFMSKLPPSLAGEVALVIRADIVESVHVFRYLSPQRIARALRPQLLQPDTTIYSRGDLGEEMYFILSGSVKKFIDDSAKVEVSRVMYIEKNKHAYLRGSYYKGCHFGEMCLISQHARREATAVAETECQVYSLHKKSLWEIFQYMTRQDQRVFLIHLYTEVNGYCHTLFDEENINMKLIARTLTSTIDNLYNLADSVMNEIMDEGIRAGKIPESIKLVNDTFIKKQPTTQSPVVGLLSCPWFEVLQVYEQKKVEVMSHTHNSLPTGGAGAAGQPPPRVSRAVNFSHYVSQQGGGNGDSSGETAPSDPNEIFYQRYSRRVSKKAAAATEFTSGGSGKSNAEEELHSDASSHGAAAVNPEDLSGASSSHSCATPAPARPSIDEMLRLRIMDLFQFMDSDDTGEVSREQILESLKALGWEGVTGEVLDKMIQDADRSGKDRVDCEGIVDVILAAMGDVAPSSRYSPSAVVPLEIEP